MNTAAEMTAMMKMVISNGTGRAANIGKPAAGKTGTTDDNKDAYFMGYTPNIVTGVWVGNDDNTVMNKSIQGGTVPALIWKDIMKVATEPYGKAEFNYPTVELVPFGSINPDRVIGAPIKAQQEEKSDEIDLDETEPNLPESVKKIEQQQSKPQPVTPKPVAAQVNKPVAPKQTAAPVPIPMAVPEGVR